MKTCKDETLGIDFTLDSFKTIKDMIVKIKSLKSNYDIKDVFKFLNHKYDINKKHKKFDKIKNNNSISNIDYNDFGILKKEKDKNVESSDLERSKFSTDQNNNLITNQNKQKNISENNWGNLNLNQLINNYFMVNFSNNIQLIK